MLDDRHRILCVSWLFLAAVLCFAGCVPHSVRTTPPGLPWRESRQLVLVLIPDWNADHGRLRTYAREGDRWHAVDATQPVTIGHAGAAWGLGLPRLGVPMTIALVAATGGLLVAAAPEEAPTIWALNAAGRIDWSSAVIDGSHIRALLGGCTPAPRLSTVRAAAQSTT